MPIQITTTLPDEDQPLLGNGVEDEVAVDRESTTTNNGSVRVQIRETGESSWDSNATGFGEFIGAYDTLTMEFVGREDGEEYEVRARSETDYRTGVWTQPVAITTKFPGATGLTATTVSSTEIDLTWTDNADNEDGQEVVRERRGPDGDWWPDRVIDDAGVNAESYVDDTAQPGREYRYRIRPYTEHTSAVSGADTASTPALDVADRRVPATGPYVEIDSPNRPAPLTPTILTEPEISGRTNALPEARIPVPSNERWQADTLKGQSMRVWQDGVQQPIDTFETVETSAGNGGDEMVLVGSGGRELDQYVDDLQITEQETHLAVRDVIDQYTGYGRNVDDPETDTRADVQMLLESNSTIAEIVEAPATTDPYRITQLRGLHNLQTGWFAEAEDVDYTGVQEFAEFEGNAGAWSNGSAVVLSDVGDQVSLTFNPGYELPGGNSQLRLLWAIVGSEAPAISVSVDGTETDSAQYDAIPIQASDKFDLNWNAWGLSSNSIDSITTVTLEITQASDASIYVDALFVNDTRFSYTYDNTPVDGEVQGPEQYPVINVETVPAQSVEQVIGGSLDVVANTGEGLAVAVSNDQGQTWTEDTGTSVATTFVSASQEIRGRIQLGRQGADDNSGLAAGAHGHEISEVDLRASLEDTPVLLDKQPRGRLYETFANWAEEANALWALRRDPAADADDPSGMILEWTLAGQRTRTSDAGVVSYDGSETVESSYDQVVVFGSSQDVQGETFTANDPGLLKGLDEAWIKIASERVTDPNTGERFARVTDYVIDWREGAIEITDAGGMTAGTTYQIDYEWRYRGAYPPTDQLVDPSTADVVEDQIPSATSNRECEQLALGIFKRIQDPLVEVELTVVSDAADPSLLASLSHPELPFDGPLKLRERTPSTGGVSFRLANREISSEVFDEFREQFSALADRV